MIILVNKLLPSGIRGMAIFPFIFVNDKKLLNNKVLINHEKIHIKQQIEMLIVFFYLWYGLEYVVKFFTTAKDVYRDLSFEREAYENERNLDYLKNRKAYAWFKKIVKK